MVVASAHCLSRGDRAIGPVLAQENRQADADVDYIPVLRRHVFAADLFYRLQAARR